MNQKQMALDVMHPLREAAEKAYAAYWVEDEGRRNFLWKSVVEKLNEANAAIAKATIAKADEPEVVNNPPL